MAMEERRESVERLSRDLRIASATLSDREARYLVDAYYSFQEDRMRADARAREMAEESPNEPHDVIVWLARQSDTLEVQIKAALQRYAQAHPVGVWALSQVGVGPVITSGYLANIDITQADTAGSLWRYCGLEPGQRRERGKKSNYNPSLKRLSWIVGESFKRFSGNPDCYYGQQYKQRKAYEVAKNESFAYREQAKFSLENKKYKDDTVAKTFYAQGMLPPARIDLRACRWATKLFIAHLHEVWYTHHYGKPPPLPYPIARLNHATKIDPPGLAETRKRTKKR